MISDPYDRAFLQREQQSFFDEFQKQLLALATEAGYSATAGQIEKDRFVYQYGLGDGQITVLIGEEGNHDSLIIEEPQGKETRDYQLQVKKNGSEKSLYCVNRTASEFANYLLEQFGKDLRSNQKN